MSQHCTADPVVLHIITEPISHHTVSRSSNEPFIHAIIANISGLTAKVQT